MSNHELDYLISLKQAALIRLQDVLRCNSSVKLIEDAKESYDLINYNIDLLKKKHGIVNYNDNVGINIPIEPSDNYSSFVAYKSDAIPKRELGYPEYSYLVPKSKNSTDINSQYKKYAESFNKKEEEREQLRIGITTTNVSELQEVSHNEADYNENYN